MEMFGLAMLKARTCADIGIFVLAEAYPRSEAGIEATKPTKKKRALDASLLTTMRLEPRSVTTAWECLNQQQEGTGYRSGGRGGHSNVWLEELGQALH